jgi:hypothetical protein
MMRHVAHSIHKKNAKLKNTNELIKDLVITKYYPNRGRINAVECANVYHKD